MKAILTAPGLGPATATAILLIAHPDRYGVWNGVSEKGLRKLGLWPAAPRGTGEGGKYEEINKVLHRLRDDLKLDLWSLDACWWGLMKPGRQPVG